MTTEIDPPFHLITGLLDWPARGATATMVIATRYEITGAGIEALLRAGGHRVVARCLHEDDLLRCSEACGPDIVMLEEGVGQDSAKTISRLRARKRTAIIFLLEECDAIKIAGLLDLDVDGILLSRTRARRLIACVESMAYGQTWVDPELVRHLAMAAEPCPQTVSRLTPRESNIAQLVFRGLCNKEIARELHLSEGTVKMHLHHIYEKLRLGGRTQLALSIAGSSGIQAGPALEPAYPGSAAVAWVHNGRPPKNLA
jgi:DNA-binding NarL/FixJ family response regulator